LKGEISVNIEISAKAKAELLSLMAGSGNFLRIQVITGGCAGLSYHPGFDNEMDDDDVILYDNNGLKVVADMRSALYTRGLEIDYSDDLVNSGFRFANRKTSKSCGCGHSFEA
jgi:iron-sulfur cluster assembly protein